MMSFNLGTKMRISTMLAALMPSLPECLFGFSTIKSQQQVGAPFYILSILTGFISRCLDYLTKNKMYIFA